MKKIGTYTARGIVTESETEAGTPQKIPLFDGKFTTAFRVTRFQIWSESVSGSGGFCVGKLSKNEFGSTAALTFFRADDDNQIGWSQSSAATDGGNELMGDSIIDRDNMIVEDLFVYARTNVADTNVNYIIEMDKYEITDWKGALTMAQDRQQE